MSSFDEKLPDLDPDEDSLLTRLENLRTTIYEIKESGEYPNTTLFFLSPVDLPNNYSNRAIAAEGFENAGGTPLISSSRLWEDFKNADNNLTRMIEAGSIPVMIHILSTDSDELESLKNAIMPVLGGLDLEIMDNNDEDANEDGVILELAQNDVNFLEFSLRTNIVIDKL
jgi:hypothetical protein